MVKLVAGLLIILVLLSTPFFAAGFEYGLITALFYLAVFLIGCSATLLGMYLIFKGMDERARK